VLPEFVTIKYEEVEEEVVGGDGTPDVTTEEGEEEEVEDGLFIPCGWPRKQERKYYRASDPEWKEFIKFSQEKERHQDVQKRLVSGIRSELAGHPQGKHMLGKIDMNKGRYWLEIIFPDGPPQEYYVRGIEITEEFIAWSEKTVSQKEYSRLYNTMVPTATIAGSWATFKYHFDTQANKVREYFGLQPKIDPHIAHMKSHLRERPNTKHLNEGSKPSRDSGASLSKGLPPTQTSPSSSSSSSSPSSQSNDGESPPGSSGETAPRLPSIVPRGESKPVTLALMMQNLRKHRAHVHIEPPRGSIVVTGLIEVIGTRGRTTLDVTAAFDPKADEYLVWSWRPRRIQPKRQVPKGGP